MCAVGLSGQLGLNGRLPWEGDPRPEFRADVARFFDKTRGHVLMAGPRTIASVPRFAFDDRTIVTLRSGDAPQDMIERFRGRVIYVGGGPSLWDAYAPFIRHWDITRLPYDGEADRWFNPAWLLAGEPASATGAGRSPAR